MVACVGVLWVYVEALSFHSDIADACKLQEMGGGAMRVPVCACVVFIFYIGIALR